MCPLGCVEENKMSLPGHLRQQDARCPLSPSVLQEADIHMFPAPCEGPVSGFLLPYTLPPVRNRFNSFLTVVTAARMRASPITSLFTFVQFNIKRWNFVAGGCSPPDTPHRRFSILGRMYCGKLYKVAGTIPAARQRPCNFPTF